jgi:hypothetical protein
MIYIQYLNAQIKAHVIEKLVHANVSLVMKVLLANVLHVQMLALVEVLAGQKSI